MGVGLGLASDIVVGVVAEAAAVEEELLTGSGAGLGLALDIVGMWVDLGFLNIVGVSLGHSVGSAVVEIAAVGCLQTVVVVALERCVGAVFVKTAASSGSGLGFGPAILAVVERGVDFERVTLGRGSGHFHSRQEVEQLGQVVVEAADLRRPGLIKLSKSAIDSNQEATLSWGWGLRQMPVLVQFV